MPQVKQNFIGDRLDTHMPKILHNRMNPEEWNHFVREINTAIREAQSYMRFSPWLITGLVCVAILVILLDIALSQSLFGNVQVGTLTLSAFVTTGVLIICYMSMCRPTNYCESEVELICEDYCDPERDIYFFYRHHNNMVHVTENRFYIEVFVGELPEGPTVIQEETPAEVQRETDDVEWANDAIPEASSEAPEPLLLTTGTAETTALTVSTQDTPRTAAPQPKQPLLMDDDAAGSYSQELVPTTYRAGPSQSRDLEQVFPRNTARSSQRSSQNRPAVPTAYRAGPSLSREQIFPRNTARSSQRSSQNRPLVTGTAPVGTSTLLVPAASSDIVVTPRGAPRDEEEAAETALVPRASRDIV